MNASSPATAAVVAAAGKSQRMGQPKLLLLVGGQPLIAKVVAALREGGASPVIVVSPPADSAEGPGVAATARQAGAIVLTPLIRPPEMRDSVELALEHLAREGPPPAFLLTPADCPGITPGVVSRLIQRRTETPDAIIVPRVAGRRAHPLLLPWDLARLIPSLLPRHQGVRALLDAYAARVVEIELECPELAEDLDTPEDLERWRGRQIASPSD